MKDDMFPEEIAQASLNLLESSLGPDKKLPSALREAGSAVAKAGRDLQYWVHRRQALAKELPIYEKEVKLCYEKAMKGEAMRDDDDDETVKEPPKQAEGEIKNGPLAMTSSLEIGNSTTPRSSFEEAVVGKDPAEEAFNAVECKDFLPSAALVVSRRAASEAYWNFDRSLNGAVLAVGRAMDDALSRGA